VTPLPSGKSATQTSEITTKIDDVLIFIGAKFEKNRTCLSMKVPRSRHMTGLNSVHLHREHNELKAAKAKSAQRRIVPIQPNLAAWLAPYMVMKSRVVPQGARGKLERVRKATKLSDWPINGLRHSYASYRLAAIHDAPRVASELGHTSPQMLYNTYRELVLPAETERYWKIDPAAETEEILAFNTVT
jgi:integrase